MHRFVSLILISSLVLGPCVCTHAHVGPWDGAEGQGERPHIHLNGEHGRHHHGHHGHFREHHDHGQEHHGHRVGGEKSELQPLAFGDNPVDHDSDAVYVDSTELFRDVRTTTIALPKPVIESLSAVEGPSPSRRCLSGSHLDNASWLKCPLYLRMLCIRC